MRIRADESAVRQYIVRLRMAELFYLSAETCRFARLTNPDQHVKIMNEQTFI